MTPDQANKPREYRDQQHGNNYCDRQKTISVAWSIKQRYGPTKLSRSCIHCGGMLEVVHLSEVSAQATFFRQAFFRVNQRRDTRGRKVSDGRVLNSTHQWTCRPSLLGFPADDWRDVKLLRLSGWNLVRAERSKLCMYAFDDRRSTDQGVYKQIHPINTCQDSTFMRSISRP